ncbi:PRA1 family protein 2 isoform X2 [Gopherus flavomarginatus]|uniref:PRA1 family protein 2 isoform X2 n=1 Tax=Gopherus flavomarginatus TaxID=286002 RepID=UPI0021CC4D20|nr:PRA1 family protein 2 isoform X2 [Gopherus flavomarginatus]
MSEVRPPPLRALDDFLLGPARLAAPDPRDPQRWRNRVLNNLLYYQSNYGLGLGLALLLGGYFRPLHTLLSSSTVTLVFVAFVWAAENKAPIRRFRRSYPGASLLAVLGSAYGLVSLLGGSEVFLLTVALPISMILIHASVRLRNLKNKIENKIESIGLKRTPMGLLLEAMGQEQEAGS